MIHPILSAQQASFYTKSRYLELEELLSPLECEAFFAMMTPSRDLWRKNPSLKDFLLSRKIAQMALHLTGKSVLQLACDQWFPPDFFKEGKTIKFKDFFSIQGIAIVFLMQLQPGVLKKPAKALPVGLFPFPERGQGCALIVHSDLLISWPPLVASFGLYAVAFSLSPAIYIQNSNDPAALFLKQLGYSYGDRLTHETHPRIVK